MNIADIDNLGDEFKAIEYLRKLKILRSEITCPNGHAMKKASRTRNAKVLYYWRCSKCSDCTASVKKDSIFEDYRISVLIILKLMAHWALMTSYNNMETLVGVNDPFSTLHYAKITNYSIG